MINYNRTKTHEVKIGKTPLGGQNPVRIQSMTNTNTMDVDATVEQCKKIIDKGADYVRITTQTVKHAEHLKPIKEQLRAAGYNTPIVADVHFNPKVAEVAATLVEKVRINPGNYADKKQFKQIKFTNAEYQAEIDRIEERLLPLLEICKQHNTAIRIGTNHGSLSDRIMSRYGDTAKGMVEATMEFLRICQKANFSNLVISLKASNTVVMVHACRLLVNQMKAESMDYPLHLGVTEAGNETEGRIKSAAGIGALLVDGIGDTIRVSLTESPENEIPVAKQIVKSAHKRESQKKLPENKNDAPHFEYKKRKSYKNLNIGGENVPIVVADYSLSEIFFAEKVLTPDYIFLGSKEIDYKKYPDIRFILDIESWKYEQRTYPHFTLKKYLNTERKSDIMNFLSVSYDDLSKSLLDEISEEETFVLIPELTTDNTLGELRLFYQKLEELNSEIPVLPKIDYFETDLEHFQIRASVDLGVLLIDGFADGIFLCNPNIADKQKITDTTFDLLQATRRRTSKTEYISCPSCGRTLFDLEETTAEIKAKTSHLKELKIGIMGCIVNGPGEMADADYGYVGAGAGRVTLYKGKTVVQKNIPKENAVEELIKLIKENGDWKER